MIYHGLIIWSKYTIMYVLYLCSTHASSGEHNNMVGITNNPAYRVVPAGERPQSHIYEVIALQRQTQPSTSAAGPSPQ